MRIDDSMRRSIHDGAGELALRDAALAAGMPTLRQDAARWISEGRTSLAEVMRVTRDG
jgi:general secretion pathway protein E